MFDTYFSTGHKRRNPAIPKPALCGGDLGECAEEHTGHLAGQGYCGRGRLADNDDVDTDAHADDHVDADADADADADDDADGGCGWVTVV